MLEDKETVIGTLRACLMSTKEGVSVSHLQQDYKSLIGQPIPYQKCGFPTLEKFLRSVPGIRISVNRSGDLMVEAVASESSAHISSLISRQKKSGSKRRPSRPFAPSRKPTQSSWKPPPSSYRNPPPRALEPLSITLSNRNDNHGSFEKNFRRVTVSNTSSSHYQYSPPISPNQNNSNSTSPVPKDHSHKFRRPLPPRMQKSTSKISPEPTENTSADVLNVQTDDTVAEDLRKRLQTRMSFNVEKPETVPEEYGYQTGLCPPPKLKTITSPFAPSLAVAAGRAKTDADAINDLKKSYASYMQPHDEVETQADAVNDLKKNYASYMQPLDVKVQEYNPPQVKQDYHQSQSRGQWSPGYETRTSPPNKAVASVYCEKLKAYSLKKGWPEPVYKILPRYPKYQRTLFGCQVKIGNDQQFASYPDESVIPEEAREFAAKKAYTKLEQMDREASIDTDKVTEDKALMCERVSKLVSLHTNGLWSYMVLDTYKKTYHETVPDDWLTILTSCPNVSMTKVSENKVIITPNQPSLDNLTQYNIPMAAYVEPKAQEEVLYVSEITLPEENYWSIYITCVNSTTEVWARLIGDEYSTEYENMTTDMELFYLRASTEDSVETPEVGYYYAAPFEDTWYRVCVQEIVDDKAVCWLIDHGDFEDFPFHKLFKLDKKFFSLQRQAIQCQMAGLEEYGDEKIAYNLMVELLLGKTFVADVQVRDTSSGIMTMVLYDTSTEEDVNVNETLINRICIEGAKPQLPCEGTIKEVYISTVTDKGEVYLQIRSESFFHLIRLITGLNPSVIEENKVTSFKDITMNKLYLAKYSRDSNWYRALVVQPPSPQYNKIEVRFVDFGYSDTITISEIAEIESISSVLANLPYQAIKVQLHNVPALITLQKATRIQELLQNAQALVKVIVAGEVPVVEIFKRSLPENVLVSINNTIVHEATDNLQQQEPRKRTIPNVGIGMKYQTENGQGDGLPTRGLRPPQIPSSPEEYFDIYVPMAASPSNFTVQPLKYMAGLSEIMTNMQDYYAQNNSELEKGSIFEGGVYAVINTDHNWYRATVTSVISPKMVSVHFCDFGDVSVVSTTDMKPLHQRFKELPYLAIKAKLSGVAPSHSDWSVEDCLRFQSLICDKQLVSVVMETGPDILNHAETVLGLKIIDTNTDEDIDIAELMVSEGRAILLPKQTPLTG